MSRLDLPAPDAAAIHVHTPKGTLAPMSRLDLKAKVDAGVEQMVALLTETIDALKEKLVPYKR